MHHNKGFDRGFSGGQLDFFYMPLMHLADVGRSIGRQPPISSQVRKKIAMMDNLRKNGATEAEIAFMFADFDATRRSLRRVELNAMSSPQFVDFIERKLRENNITKIIPDQDLLAESYRLFKRGQCIEKIVEKELKNLDGDDANVPDNLEQCVSEMLAKNPALRWTEAMQRIVKSYTDAA